MTKEGGITIQCNLTVANSTCNTNTLPSARRWAPPVKT
jgi:hypothetical protein